MISVWWLPVPLLLVAMACESGQQKVVREPMELSAAAKLVQGLEPVIDQRWQQPICLLAREAPPIVVRVPCKTLWGWKTTEKKTNRVVTHQTLYPPEPLPAERYPVPKVEDITRDASPEKLK